MIFDLFNHKQKQLNIRAVCLSHIGNVRENNEDNYLYNGRFLPMIHNDEIVPMVENYDLDTAKIFAVMDGMGGESAGELASFVAASELSKYFNDNLLTTETFHDGSFLFDKLIEISDVVYFAGKEKNYSTIGTTLSMIIFFKDYGIVCNIGDSPIYRFRDGSLKEIYHAHTNEEWLKQQGINRKPGLIQFLGISSQDMIIQPYIEQISLMENDIYLICSDGLTDMVSENVIVSILNSEDDLYNKGVVLINTALDNGGKDNITIVLCRIFM